MRFFKFNRVRLLWLVIAVLLLICFIPVRIAATFGQVPIPQGIFVLGGAAERMEFAGKFWQSRRDLDIWVSDFDWNLDANRRIFAKFGVPESQLHLDSRASDTVTNFTSLVDNFVDAGLRHVYLIASDFHMKRAVVIATVVLGSRGIVVTPVAVDSGRKDE